MNCSDSVVTNAIIWHAKTCAQSQTNMRQVRTQNLIFLSLKGGGLWDGRVAAVVGEIVGEKDGGETEWMTGNSRLREWMRKKDGAELSCSLHTQLGKEEQCMGGSSSSSFNKSGFSFALWF